MNKPKGIEEFIKENPKFESIIREALKVYENERAWYNYHVCAVCDNEITEENKYHEFMPEDFATNLCKEHHQYSKCFQFEFIRAGLGYPLKGSYGDKYDEAYAMYKRRFIKIDS